MSAIVQQRQLSYEQLSPRQKAALLLLALDVETAAKVFQGLRQQDIEQVSVEIAALDAVPKEITAKVIEEFYNVLVSREYMLTGGVEYARLLLERTFGPEKSRELLEKVKMLSTVRGFDILKKADPQQLASFLSKEHPQTIALLLSHLPTNQSAEVLERFPDDLRTDVIIRIATLGKVSPTIVQQIEQVVDQIAEQTLSQNLATAGGAQIVASILNLSPPAIAKTIMEQIEQTNPQLAQDIKRMMFLFEDILLIDDRGIQRILRDVDRRDLILALRGADERLRAKIFKNMSERAAKVVKEELELMGPVKLKDVEAAQQRIVEIVKRLEEQEGITISGRGRDEVYI
ncbi:MAG: flagellar motor switch protein FliG [Chlorobi bacterium NICIL-2]|nr:MAG: flagellar motor switch protein FliG [Chlorobi bacterium NICIL-2]